MSNCYDIDPDQIRRLTEAMQRQTRAERAQKRREIREALQRFAHIDVARRRPAPVVPLSAAQLRLLVIELTTTAFDDPRVVSVTVETLHELEGFAPNLFPGLEALFRNNPQLLEHTVWQVRERIHAQRVIETLLDAAIKTFRQELPRRLAQRHRELGTGWMAAHFGIATTALAPTFTPVEIPAKLLFAGGTVYQIATDFTGLAIELMILSQRPEQRILDLLSGLHSLLALAFGPDQNAIARAREFGAHLARSCTKCLDEALFPDPLGTDAQIVFSGPVLFAIAAAQRAGPTAASIPRLASVLLTPWTLGRFIGPLLLDIGLAILDLLFPGAISAVLADLLRLQPRLARLASALGLVDDFFHEASEVSQQARRIARAGELPVPEIGHGGPVTSAERLVGSGVETGERATVPRTGVRTTSEPVTTPAPARRELDIAEPRRYQPPTSEELAEARHARDERQAGRQRQRAEQPSARDRGRAAVARMLERFRTEFGIDINDPYTRQYLERQFARLRGQYAISDADVLVTHARAEAGELRQLIRYSRRGPRGGPNVESIRFVPTGSERTPDLQIVRRINESRVTEYVEVRTTGQASRGERLSFEEGRRSRGSRRISAREIESKLFRGQISARRPGTIVFHSTFGDVADELEAWQAVFNDILRRRRSRGEVMPAGLRRVEFTGSGDAILVFEPPNWQGRLEFETR